MVQDLTSHSGLIECSRVPLMKRLSRSNSPELLSPILSNVWCAATHFSDLPQATFAQIARSTISEGCKYVCVLKRSHLGVQGTTSLCTHRSSSASIAGAVQPTTAAQCGPSRIDTCTYIYTYIHTTFRNEQYRNRAASELAWSTQLPAVDALWPRHGHCDGTTRPKLSSLLLYST